MQALWCKIWIREQTDVCAQACPKSSSQRSNWYANAARCWYIRRFVIFQSDSYILPCYNNTWACDLQLIPYRWRFVAFTGLRGSPSPWRTWISNVVPGGFVRNTLHAVCIVAEGNVSIFGSSKITPGFFQHQQRRRGYGCVGNIRRDNTRCVQVMWRRSIRRMLEHMVKVEMR